jgi:hypothetical protein
LLSSVAQISQWRVRPGVRFRAWVRENGERDKRVDLGVMLRFLERDRVERAVRLVTARRRFGVDTLRRLRLSGGVP